MVASLLDWHHYGFDRFFILLKIHGLGVEAPEAALAAKRPTAKSKGKSKGNSKGSTTPPPPSRPVATPARKGAVASEEVPTPPQGASGNPAPQKRLRGKVPDDAKDREIAELKKADWGADTIYKIGTICDIKFHPIKNGRTSLVAN